LVEHVFQRTGVGGADFGQKVVLARHTVQFEHLRHLSQPGSDVTAVGAAVVADGDEGGEVQAQPVRIDAQREALDHAALDHLAHALVHRGRG
jgi:hypothetical protein